MQFFETDQSRLICFTALVGFGVGGCGTVPVSSFFTALEGLDLIAVGLLSLQVEGRGPVLRRGATVGVRYRPALDTPARVCERGRERSRREKEAVK